MKLLKTFLTASTEAAFFHVAFLAATTSLIGAVGADTLRTYSVIGFSSIGTTTGLGFSFGFSFLAALFVLKLSTLADVLAAYLLELFVSEAVLLFAVVSAVAAFLVDEELSDVVAESDAEAVSFAAEVLFESV